MNVSQIYWLKIKFLKTETWFWLISSCHWKTLVPFCLLKERPEFLTLIVNYRKIAQKNKSCHSKQKQIMPFKTTVNWLFIEHDVT